MSFPLHKDFIRSSNSEPNKQPKKNTLNKLTLKYSDYSESQEVAFKR